MNNQMNNKKKEDSKPRDVIAGGGMNKTLCERRKICLFGEIKKDNVMQIVDLIHMINTYDNHKHEEDSSIQIEPIQLWINSQGGSVPWANTLVDTMLTSETEIHTYAVGCISSCATNVFAAGDKRFSTNRTKFMIHDATMRRPGMTVSTYEDTLESSTELRDITTKFICEQTDITWDRLNEVFESGQDWYFYGEEAHKMNLVTELISGRVGTRPIIKKVEEPEVE